MNDRLDGNGSAFSAAIALLRDGDHAAAIPALRALLEREPDNGDAASCLGVALRSAGRAAEGRIVLEKAVAAHPGHVDLNYNAGNALRDAGQLGDALRLYDAALTLRPDHRGAATNKGLCLESLGRLDQAVRHYAEILTRHPDEPDILHNLGVVRWLQGKLTAAVIAYRRAIALRADFPRAHYNLGLALDALGRHREAEDSLRQALALEPAMTDAMSGLGQNLLSQGRIDDAMPWFERSLAADSDHLDGRLGRVRGHLLAGRLKTGFAEFGWHRKRDTWKAPKVTGTAWDGGDLAGRSILLYGEQGLGDVLHVSRFASRVASLGARVHLYCSPPLVRILGSIEGVEAVHSDDAPAPSTDFVCSLIELPRIFAIDLEDLPGTCPYLTAPNPSPPPGTGRPFRFGLVWAGNPAHQRDRDRSCPVRHLTPLLGIPGTVALSLQVGPAAASAAAAGFEGLLLGIGARLEDFAHTADILSGLDLLITVDTAIAHLAGALGTRVWTLLAYAPDWRWMLGRDDTPWYPSMRLYRQPGPHDWEAVIARVAVDLTQEVAAHRLRMTADP